MWNEGGHSRKISLQLKFMPDENGQFSIIVVSGLSLSVSALISCVLSSCCEMHVFTVSYSLC